MNIELTNLKAKQIEDECQIQEEELIQELTIADKIKIKTLMLLEIKRLEGEALFYEVDGQYPHLVKDTEKEIQKIKGIIGRL